MELMFHDSGDFPFVSELERNWRVIYSEYLAIRDDLMPWPETKLYDEVWQVFGLYDFPHGGAIEANTLRCPFTASLVARLIPRHGAAGYSVLGPGTRIKPHQGYPGSYLRCHLGLTVPVGDCGLRVEGASRTWEEGKVLIFDDRLTHEAWNLTGAERVVLLIDFVPTPR
jgi:beta-hydroxylase